MSFSVTVSYDRKLLRRALNRFYAARMGLGLLIGFPLGVVALLALFLLNTWSSFLSVVSGLLAVTGAAILYIYFLRLRTSEGFFEKAKNPTVTFVFSEEGVRTESEIGSSDLRWSVFDELLQFPDVWLLIYAKSAYITLPTSELSEDCKRFIEERFGTRPRVG